MRRHATILLVGLVALATLAAGVLAQDIEIVPRLTGPADPMETGPAPPIPDTESFEDACSYPGQPPVIPHSIEGYQLTLATNRCLECHRRQFTSLVGAPMISITHFMNRQQQMLADVSPRRYVCTAYHVPQTEARPLIDNLTATCCCSTRKATSSACSDYGGSSRTSGGSPPARPAISASAS